MSQRLEKKKRKKKEGNNRKEEASRSEQQVSLSGLLNRLKEEGMYTGRKEEEEEDRE